MPLASTRIMTYRSIWPPGLYIHVDDLWHIGGSFNLCAFTSLHSVSCCEESLGGDCKVYTHVQPYFMVSTKIYLVCNLKESTLHGILAIGCEVHTGVFHGYTRA